MKSQEIQTGSTKELFKLSLPLMISFMSIFVMIFVDRIFLSYYSPEALNAATSAGTFSWSLILAWTTLATLAEVFVAQHNGAKQYKMLGKPVWQMMWLGLISFLFFIPMGLWGSSFFYGEPSVFNYEHQYFKWTMFFSPISVFLAALTAFFIGQGKTSIIKWLALIGNIVNVALDPILIFGVKGWISPMGVSGACISTGIGICVQLVIILFLFLSKQNKASYGTNEYRFDKPLFFRCIRVGLPPALFVFVELLGWALFYLMMSYVSPRHLLVSSVCQSILLLFVFFGLGIEKGAAAVAGNLIGAKKTENVRNVLFSGCRLISIFSIVICFFFVICPDFLINWFFKNPESFEATNEQLSLLQDKEQLEAIKASIRFCLIFTGIHMIIEYGKWLINGVLTAAGDTFFLMVTGALCVWLFLLTPTYFFVVKMQAPIEFAISIWTFYSCTGCLVMLFRYRQGKWKKKSLLIDESQEEMPALLQADTSLPGEEF